MRDYEDAVAFLGQWGRFQQVLFFLLCAIFLPGGYGVFAIVFFADFPRHCCLVPEVNLSREWSDAIIPMEVVNGKEEPSRCSRFRLDLVRNLSAQGLIPGRDVDLQDLEQEGCVDGWSYSTDIYQSTIVSEFDLVCDDQWKQPFTSTIQFLGIFCGSAVAGPLSDRFGRKPVFFTTTVIQTVFRFALIFSPSWTVFCVLYFISSLGMNSNYLSGFVLGTEIFTSKVRVVYSSMGVTIGFAVGYMLLSLVAYFLRDWKSLLVALSLPGLLYIPLWWWVFLTTTMSSQSQADHKTPCSWSRFIPESPRWLLSQGRLEEAEAVVRKAAKTNKVEAPRLLFEGLHADDTKTFPEEQHSVFNLLKTRNIRNTTLILILVWVTMSTGYYGLSLNTSSFHDNSYIRCFISALVELPAYVFSWLALQYVSRRPIFICILLIGAASLFLIQLVPHNLSELSFALEMVGKFTLTVISSMIYVYTAEVYPTVLRTTATALFSTFAKAATAVAPFLWQLGEDFHHIVLGTLAVVSAFAFLFLPESFERPLPQTIQQMQETRSLKRSMFSK